MVIGTIQAINASEGAPNEVVRDGEFVVGEEALEVGREVYRLLRETPFLSEEDFFESKGKRHLQQYHPVHDNSDRIRPAVIVWDKTDSEEIIKKTVEKMGLDFDRFNEIRRSKKSKKKMIGILGVFLVLAIVVAIILIQILSKQNNYEYKLEQPNENTISR